MKLTSKKVFFIMIGVVVLSFGLIVGAVIVGNTLLHKQSDKLVNLKLENSVTEAQQTALIQAKKDVDTYSQLDTTAKQIVPQDKDQAKAVREIVSIAALAGIKIASVTFPTSNLGQKVTIDPTSKTPAPTNPVTQAIPVKGIDGLYELDTTIVSDTGKPITYAKLIDFLQRLEQNRRTAQVSQIAIQPVTQNRNLLTFTLTLQVYIKP